MREVRGDVRAKIVAYRALYTLSLEAHATEAAEIRDLLLRMDQRIFAALVTRVFEEEKIRRQFVSALSLANVHATPRSYESEAAPQAVHTLLLDSALSGLTEEESTRVLDHTDSFAFGRRIFQRLGDESNRLSAHLHGTS
jgi:hypothetical protein